MEQTIAAQARGAARDAAPGVPPLPGTSIILTADGARRMDGLRAGARVITRDAGMVRLQGITHRRGRPELIRVRAGSLGDARPDRDTLLPADQPVLLRDWRASALFGARQAVVPLRRLVDGEFVAHATPAEIALCTLDFAGPHILYVNGMELASVAPAQAWHNAA